jgi:hypothetical protein
MNALRYCTGTNPTTVMYSSLRERLGLLSVSYCECLAFNPTSLLDSLPLSFGKETKTTLESTTASEG